MPTIKDVARLAGVSFKTVSRVINRSPHVKDDVRQRVLRAADALEYRTHHHARHMRTQKSKVFAFIGDDIATTPFAGQIIQGAQETALQRGMLLLTFNTGGAPAVEESAVQMALERAAEGIIFAAMYHRAIRVPKTALHLPLVLVDCFAPDTPARCVVPDEFQGGYRATKFLLEKGHPRIARPGAHFKIGNLNGCQRRSGVCCQELLIIKTDDRNVARNMESFFFQCVIDPHRDTITNAEDRGRDLLVPKKR